jgi:hypothetical protein
LSAPTSQHLLSAWLPDSASSVQPGHRMIVTCNKGTLEFETRSDWRLTRMDSVVAGAWSANPPESLSLMPYGVRFPVMPGQFFARTSGATFVGANGALFYLALTVPLLFAYAFLWQCQKGVCDIRTQKIEGSVDDLRSGKNRPPRTPLRQNRLQTQLVKAQTQAAARLQLRQRMCQSSLQRVVLRL